MTAIVGAAEKAARLTRKMLAYSGKGHFDMAPLDLSATVERMRPLLEHAASGKAELLAQ